MGNIKTFKVAYTQKAEARKTPLVHYGWNEVGTGMQIKVGGRLLEVRC